MTQLASLQTLFDVNALRRHLGEVAVWFGDAVLQTLLARVFVRDLKVSPNPAGDGQSCTFKLVLPQAIALDLPVGGMRLALNPAAVPGSPSVLEGTLSYRLPMLRYAAEFDAAAIAQEARAGYDFLRGITAADDPGLIAATIVTLIDAQDPVQQFLDDFADRHGALAVTPTGDAAADASDIAVAMHAAGVDPVDYVFEHHIDTATPAHAQARLSMLFSPSIDFAPDDLTRLVTPTIEAAVQRLTLSLGLPRWLLVPIKTAAHSASGVAPQVLEGEPLPEPYQCELRASIGTLGFSTARGLQSGGGVECSLDSAQIGATGLRLTVPALTLDLSPGQTSRRLRDAGFSAGFVGAHARDATLTWRLPFDIDGVPGADIALRLSDLAIGNQGLLAVVEQAWAIDPADPTGPASQSVARVAGGFRVALREASGTLVYLPDDQAAGVPERWQLGVAIAGLLQLPFGRALIGARFALELDGGSTRTRVNLELSSTPLMVELGDGARLQFDTLDAGGVLAGDGSTDLLGSARGMLDVTFEGVVLLQGSFDAPALTLSYATQGRLQMDAVWNLALFAGTPWHVSVENLHSRLEAVATASGIEQLSLELSGFNAELQLGDALALRIEDCVIDLNPDASPQPILDLGFDAAFVGLMARRGTLNWRPPGSAEALQVELGLIAIGSTGAAFRQSWVTAPVMLELFDQMSLGLTSVDGLLLLDGRPGSRLEIGGQLQSAMFSGPLLARLTLQQGPTADQVRLALHGSAVEVDLNGAGSLSIDVLHLDGALSPSRFALFGEIGGVTLHLQGIAEPILLGSSQMRLEYAGVETRLEIALNDAQVVFDGLAGLSFGGALQVTLADGVITGVVLRGTADWESLGSFDLPAGLPQPSLDAELSAELLWTSGAWQLGFRAALADADALLASLPGALRPDLRNIAFVLNAVQQGADGHFSGDAAVSLELRPRAISGLGPSGLITLRSPGQGGWIRAQLSAAVGGDGSQLSLSLLDLVEIDVDLPGLPQSEPVVHIVVEAATLALRDDAQLSGQIGFAGRFALRPVTPAEIGLPHLPPIVDRLKGLFGGPQLSTLSGDATLTLQFVGDRLQTDLLCTFGEAALDIDLFDLLRGAVGGDAASAADEIDLDLEIAFRPRHIAIRLGALAQDDVGDFAFEFAIGLEAAGFSTTIRLALSEQRLAFGFDRLEIPVALPELPIARGDLDALRGSDGHWDAATWQAIEATIDERLADDSDELALKIDTLEQLEASPSDDPGYAAQLFQLRYRSLPEIRKRIFHDTGNKFLTGAIMAVHRMLGEYSDSSAQAAYQGMVEVYQDAVDSSVGSLHFDTRLQFVIVDAQFVLPFDNPTDIRVEGGASLQGFAPDDPLKPLEQLAFKLGLSADAVFFSVEGGSDPIRLPDFGRYPGNGIVFDRLLIGYGYSKNSLLVDFAGELQLSPQLIEDVDSSARIGAGLRLPRNSRLKFKVDLIPIVLGEVDFLLPLLAFDIDLRSTEMPAPSGGPCTPAWDGLQFHAPGILRVDVKRAKVSPFFGPLPAPNTLYAFDMDLGDEALGFTQVCDDYQVILGAVPIPFLADATPFFERYCTDLRFAGFGVHFELRRPFPRRDPLMVFELLGLVADPGLPVDPTGHLADIMWAQLQDARISLPPPVLAMFPEQGRVITRTLDVRINVGTVIALARHLAAVIDALRERIAQAGDEIGDLVDDLTRDPPPVAVDELLASLPRELRRVELNGSFAGFAASAVFLLISPGEMRAAIQADPTDTTPLPDGQVRWVEVVHDRFSRNPLRGWRAIDHGLKRGQTGHWRVSGGALLQDHNVGDNSTARYGAALVRETEPLQDLRITVGLASGDDDGIGVLFHVQGDTSYYRFRITSAQRTWRLTRLKAGVTRVLQHTEAAYVPNRTYRVRIEARSVPQQGIALERRRQGMRVAAQELARTARTSSKPRYTTHIQIWVDDALWCDVVDADRPLTEGQVGLDSWWNSAARYTDLRIERAERRSDDPLHIDVRGPAQGVLPVVRRTPSAMPATTATVAWTVDDLAGFGDEDLLAAIEDRGVPAVVVAARVTLLAAQQYRFVGTQYADGRFALATTAAVEPLQLSVAGIDVALPLSVHGRIALRGRAAGADSWAQFSAALSGEWTLPGALARLVVGVERPAGIVADSRGHFRLQGDGELQLFDDALRIAGAVDISDAHIMLSGALEHTSPLRIAAQTPLYRIELAAQGRLGPGRDFHLTADGDLQLLGVACTAVSAELTPDGLALAARLALGDKPSTIKGFALGEVDATLRGQLGFTGAAPRLKLGGEGRLALGGVEVAGRVGIEADDDGWCARASGRVFWQGHHWLQGEVALCEDRLHVQGQARFALDLTGSALPGNIQVAGLALGATLGGRFSVRSSGRLAACRFDLDWTLALRLPGARADQSLPIIAQRIAIDLPNLSGNSSNQVLADLVDIKGITLFDLEGVVVPLPTLSATPHTALYLRSGVQVQPPSVTFPVSILTTNPGPSSAPNDPGPLPFTYWEQPTLNPEGFELTFPHLSDSPPPSNPGQSPLIELPQITLDDVSLSGGIELSDLVLGLQLRWRDGKLGIWIKQTKQFLAFDTLSQLGPPGDD